MYLNKYTAWGYVARSDDWAISGASMSGASDSMAPRFISGINSTIFIKPKIICYGSRQKLSYSHGYRIPIH